MKPLPAQNATVVRVMDSTIPSLPAVVLASTSPYSTSNRRTPSCSVLRVYPWLLFASTAVAAVFCLLYITKPFIEASPGLPQRSLPPPVIAKPAKDTVKSSLMPDKKHLPGEKIQSGMPSSAAPRADTPTQAYEQTNLRIQHILNAESPGGPVSKIDLDVPVLYQSRDLRWTPAEVAAARELLVRLADYQEKSRALRLEGAELLDSWNRLIGQSIPAAGLRADSPTLPTNQRDAADAPRAASLNTTELIHIQPAGK